MTKKLRELAESETRTTTNDTGWWNIWIDNVDGKLAMEKSNGAHSSLPVVEEQVFLRIVDERDKLANALKTACDVIDLQNDAINLAADEYVLTIETRSAVDKAKVTAEKIMKDYSAKKLGEG